MRLIIFWHKLQFSQHVGTMEQSLRFTGSKLAADGRIHRSTNFCRVSCFNSLMSHRA